MIKMKNYSVFLPKKAFKFILLCLFFILSLTSINLYSQTQYIVTPTGGVAGNTNGTGADPVCRYYNSIRYQVVYTVAELAAAGIPANSVISRLAWNVTESSVSLGNYTIKMGHTAAVNSAAHNVDASTQVKNPFTYGVALGYNDIIFDNNFTWNGTQNIVVEICTGAANPFTSPWGGVQAKTAVTSGSRSIRQDGSSACAVTTSLTNTAKPYIRFTGAVAAACSGTPNSGTAAISSATGCANSNFSLSSTGVSSGSGITYQWQISANGTSGWANVGAPGSSLITSTATNSFYKLVTTCASSGLSNSSNVVSYTVVTCCTNTLQCYDTFGDGWNGGSVNLFVGGSLYGNYTIATGFGPTTVNFPCFTGQAIQITVAAGGTYPTEMYFNVLNGAGVPLVSNYYPNTSGTWNGIANCPQPPTITSFSPSTACGTGVSVVITGTNFLGATAVAINGLAVTSYVVNSATQITAITSPSNTTGLVSVTTGVGTATSASSLAIYPFPIINTQPTAPSAFCGGTGTATLSVTTTGAVSYQWQKNGLNISGAPYTGFTSNTLTITNPSVAENGVSLTCVVTGAGGCNVTSIPQILTVGNNPATPSPVTATSSTICMGESSLLNATSAGNFINWYDAPIGGTLLSNVPSASNYSVSPTSTATYYAEGVIVNPGTPQTVTFNYTGAITTWTVPAGVTSVTINAKGAQGGTSTGTGGLGANMTGTFAVTPGQVLSILAGQQPAVNSYPGGGGGSFVALGASFASATPLIVAGGGGGAQSGAGGNASTGTSGNGPLPGTPGNGAASSSCGGGGGGFFTSGGNDILYGTAGAGGAGFQQGGAGGVSSSGYGPGGFGGGATADYVGSCNIVAGSGGGYSGGSGTGTAYQLYGFGGGSFNAGTSQTNSVNNTGNGQVVITYTPLISGCISALRQAVTVTVNLAPTANAGAALTAICAGTTSTAMGGSIGGSATTGTWSGGTGTWTNASNPALATYTAGISESGTIILTLTAIGGGCTPAIVTKTITVNALPVISAGPDATLCPSQTVVLAGTSNMMSASYIYTLNMFDSFGDGWDGAYLTAFVNGASIGTYSAAGSGSTATITVNAGQTIYFTYTSASFENEHSYSISLNGSTVYSTGSYPPTGTIYTNNSHPQTVTYSWSPGTGLSSASVLTPTCSASATTNYTLTVSKNGCSATDAAFITVIPGAAAGVLSGTQTTCIGATTTFTTNGAAGGAWTSSNAAVATVNATTGTITGISAGSSTITYTVLGVSGCPDATATRLVSVYVYPTINAGSDVTICPSSSTVLTGTSNMSDSYVYTLNMFDSFGDGWNGGYLTAFVNGASIGTYSATGTGSNATINVAAGQTIYFTYTTGAWETENSYSISLNGSVVYSIGTVHPSGTVYTNNSHPQTVSYAWSPGTSLSSTTTLSTTYTATTPTVATYSLTVTANGCASTDQVAITVQDLVPPVITCPSNVTVNSAPTSCGALVQFNAPVVTDDCAPNVLSSNLLVNGNGTAGLTGWNITQNGGNGWANSGETALGNGTSFIGSYAWCVKNQVVDLVANGYTTTQLDASPSITVSEYYKANSCCSATDQYFYQAEILNASLTPIANYNLGSIGSPVNSTAVWQQVTNTFAGYPSGARYVRITHGSKDTEFWAGQYGTVINESKVQVFIPSNLTAVQTGGLVSGSTFPVGTTANTFTATDATGNTSSCSFTVTVVDNVPPIAICQNLTVQLNSSGSTAITASQINNGSTDNCAIATLAVLPNTFTCANVGANTVILTVTDIYGNSSTCNATVTVQDNIAPTTICQNITVQLNATGNVSITGAQINNGSTDNCAIASYSVAPNSFTCANVGTNPVVLTVTDVNGNSSTCNATVTVQDNIAPIAICQNITAPLNSSGTAIITASQINNGSSDACGIFSTTINTSNFNCSNLGANTVILTVTDNNANSSTCSATVTIVDLVNPFFITTPANISNTAVASLCGRVIYYTPPTFGDNCSATMSKIDNSGLASGDIFPVGVTTQTYQLTDQSGNTAVYSFTITIVDNQNPIITNCPSNITVNTFATSCNAVVSWTAPAISDNCPGVQFTVSHTSGSQFSVGTTTVTYTATDASNNTSTCSFNVTVIDDVAPIVPVLPTITGACSATATVPTTQDNCSGTISGTTTNPLTYSSQGSHTITWVFTDGNSNTTNATQTVIVLDNVAPIITAPSAVSVYANASCSASNVALGTPVTSDNCSVVTTTNNAPSTFPLGQTIVTWTATDATGNSATAMQIVTVLDNTLPTITAPANITVSANVNCVAFNLSLGSPIVSDNCSIASVVNNGTAVYALGTTTVTWTVTDGSGNIRTATQTVTVVDNSNPIIIAPAPKTVNANAGCTATGVNLGLPVASDNCSAVVITNNAPVAFPIGNTTVTWTATDLTGHTAIATQVVTVLDNTNPTISAPAAVTVNANSNCTATGVVLGTPIASDNCTSIFTTNNAPATFPLGNTVVTWTVTDLAGHTATASQTVTVVDNQNPTIFAPATVNANTNNSCMALNVNLGTPVTSDNCSVATIVNNAPSAFNVGTTVVIWTVTDGSGHTATAAQNVIITDIEDPIILAPANINANTTSACSANGINIGTATAFDNCSIATIVSNAPASFPVGITLVVWTATDANGNTSTATQTVVINDVVNPTITAPSDITTVTNSGCTASGVVIGVPQTADNCGVASVSNNAPASFPVGTTYITWTVTDVNGNTATAIQKVTVSDNMMPTLTVAANIIVDANNSCVAFNVDLGTPVVADNCGIASLQNDAPTIYNIGITTITWIATDNNGNSISATQTVSVVDNTLPVIIAPANMQVSTNNNCVASGLNLGNAIATDNCTIASLVNDAPLDFPVGTTTVTYTVTDAAGNSATATQTITVSDIVNPTALLQNILVTLDAQGEATVSFADIDTGSSDNCGIVSTTLSKTDFDCSDIGVNNVTVIIIDNNDNTTISTVLVTIKTNGIDSDNDGIDDSCDGIPDPIEPAIPEAFTPNGNNINEYFVIGNLETFEKRQLDVYNRYGNSVYSSEDYQNDWDGTRSDNGQALPDATYYYVLKLSENDIRKGFVYINRVRQ